MGFPGRSEMPDIMVQELVKRAQEKLVDAMLMSKNYASVELALTPIEIVNRAVDEIRSAPGPPWYVDIVRHKNGMLLEIRIWVRDPDTIAAEEKEKEEALATAAASADQSEDDFVNLFLADDPDPEPMPEPAADVATILAQFSEPQGLALLICKNRNRPPGRNSRGGVGNIQAVKLSEILASAHVTAISQNWNGTVNTISVSFEQAIWPSQEGWATWWQIVNLETKEVLSYGDARMPGDVDTLDRFLIMNDTHLEKGRQIRLQSLVMEW